MVSFCLLLSVFRNLLAFASSIYGLNANSVDFDSLSSKIYSNRRMSCHRYRCCRNFIAFNSFIVFSHKFWAKRFQVEAIIPFTTYPLMFFPKTCNIVIVYIYFNSLFLYNLSCILYIQLRPWISILCVLVPVFRCLLLNVIAPS